MSGGYLDTAWAVRSDLGGWLKVASNDWLLTSRLHRTHFASRAMAVARASYGTGRGDMGVLRVVRITFRVCP